MGVEVAVAVMTTWEEVLLGCVLLLRSDWLAPPLLDARRFRLDADDLTAISSLQCQVGGERTTLSTSIVFLHFHIHPHFFSFLFFFFV